jgi:hypothetical protein
MVRGYDVLFKEPLLGALLVISALLLVTAICLWGSFHFKRMVKRDEAAKAAFRDSQRAKTENES